VQGRANDGGLRIGEMERDGIIAHGASYFLQESMLKRGDEYHIAICNNSGTIAIYNYEKGIFVSPYSDGPLKFSNDVINNTQNLKVITKYGKSFSIIKVPYSFKLLIQELQVMNIQLRIITEDNIDQLTSMNSENTKNILNSNILNLDTKDIKKELEKDIETIEKSKENEEIKEKLDDDDDDDDNSGLSQVTIDAIQKANKSYEEYKNLEDDESIDSDEEESKPPLSIGEQITEGITNVVNLLSGNNKKEDKGKIEDEKKTKDDEEKTKDEKQVDNEEFEEDLSKEKSDKTKKTLIFNTDIDNNEQTEDNNSSEKKKIISIN
jgi:DNA-directed RNA polymerase II subunit RPB2